MEWNLSLWFKVTKKLPAVAAALVLEQVLMFSFISFFACAAAADGTADVAAKAVARPLLRSENSGLSRDTGEDFFVASAHGAEKIEGESEDRDDISVEAEQSVKQRLREEAHLRAHYEKHVGQNERRNPYFTLEEEDEPVEGEERSNQGNTEGDDEGSIADRLSKDLAKLRKFRQKKRQRRTHQHGQPNGSKHKSPKREDDAGASFSLLEEAANVNKNKVLDQSSDALIIEGSEKQGRQRIIRAQDAIHHLHRLVMGRNIMPVTFIPQDEIDYLDLGASGTARPKHPPPPRSPREHDAGAADSAAPRPAAVASSK